MSSAQGLLSLATLIFISHKSFAQEFSTGCYRVRASGIIGLLEPAALIHLQAVGYGSFLLRDSEGRLLKFSEKRSSHSEPGPSDEFFSRPRSFPNLEMRSRDGRWITLQQGQFGLSHSAAPPRRLITAPADGCKEAEVDIATQAIPTKGLSGIADLHSHPFANEAFGGMLFHGKTFDPYGAAHALRSCESSHGPSGLRDLIGNGMDGTVAHRTHGFPQFDGWPSWNESNHQQMYFRWIERAYHGGLRLLVAHAVNSETLCRLARNLAHYSCDDMQAVDRQLAAAYALQDYVDAQHGGEGKGWLRIVTTAAAARRVIHSGKLAMVLGIEVDSLFGCRVGHCTEQSVLAALDAYKARGVRHIFPIHVTDNAFGGSALYTPIAFNLANKLQNGSFFAVEDCSSRGFTYQERSLLKSPLLRSLLQPSSLLPDYPQYGAHCNARSLTNLGRVLIEGMMQRGLIIDIDHMSARTLDDVLDISAAHSYPLVSGHTGFVETSAPGQKRSEGQKTDEQLRRLIRLGSVIGPILHQGKAHSEILSFGSIPNDCDESSKAWAQSYLYALSVFREEGAAPALAYGSDFNGIIHLPAPRFGTDACAGHVEQGALQQNPVRYPFRSPWIGANFDRLRSAERIYDINVDGFAHIGLLPDFIEDLSAIGMEPADINPLFHSAAAYVKMWEKAEAAAQYAKKKGGKRLKKQNAG